eukprot:Hpha_TRINITY_DN4099_c0_g1::TRINITY_DN4099_c0_g1_i1::g.63776::m.63776
MLRHNGVGMLLLLGVGCAEGVVREFNFTISNTLAMQYGQYRAYIKSDGLLYYRNDSANTGAMGSESLVPPDAAKSILVADGYYRAIHTVNGQLPGPAIEVDEGDEVVVNMVNKLETQPVTLHWHGMYQHGTNHMDGVSQVTQCATLPGQTFTYRFIADPPGTHSWHGHHGIQRPDGLFGPLIVRPKVQSARDTKTSPGRDYTMTVGVWFHEDQSQLFHKRLGPGWFAGGNPEYGAPFKWGRSVDGKLVSEIPFTSTLINGKGRWNATPAPLEVFGMGYGETARFRVINSGMSQSLRVSVDGHALTAFASDGYEFEGVGVESVVVSPGESFDFHVEGMTQGDPGLGDGNFWVRVETLEVGVHNEGRAILRYSGAPVIDPVTHRLGCVARGCVVLNCPFPAYPADSGLVCRSVHTLTAVHNTIPPPPSGGLTKFLNFAFGELSVNNRAFVPPKAPPLSQPSRAGMVPCPDSCDDAACECTHKLDIPFGTEVTLVFGNIGPHAYGLHPVHLHGHSFSVLHIGYPPYNATTGRVCEWPQGAPHPICGTTRDIVCRNGTMNCAVASWANGPPNYTNPRPPLKDTVNVPPGGYAVVRFVATNPGLWHLHCHMTHHQYSGLAMMLNEAPEKQHLFPYPSEMPTCGDFDGGAPALAARARWEKLMGEL